MIRTRVCHCTGLALVLVVFALFCAAANGKSSATVPRLVNFSGKATDLQGKAISGIAGATFAIYKEESGGAPLWLETQNVAPDSKGNYTVQLGTTKPDGLPLDLFSSGEARWLGVTINGETEQPRVLLLSVPYALKAADAETVGGLPASAFALANRQQATGTSAKPAASTATRKNAAPPANPTVTGVGVVDFIPMWDTTSDIVDSLIFQKSSQIGINTTVPAATLDVNGKSDVRDTLTLFPKGTDPTLAVNGTNFKVDQTGKVTFISGQTFPGTGTVTSVGLSAPTTDFKITGSPVTKTGTLALSWNVAPTNANTANAIVKRDNLGSFSAGAISASLGVTGLSSGSSAGVTGSNNATGYGVSGVTNSSTASGVAGINTSGTGVFGSSSGTASGSFGVEGVTSSAAAAGVAGINESTASNAIGVFGNSKSYGVFGSSTGGGGPAGVYGQMGSGSVWGIGILPTGAGVWGDTGLTSSCNSPCYAGVLGTSSGVGSSAGLFLTNSPADAVVVLSYDTNSYPFVAANNSNHTYCDVDPGGNLNCSGSKNAVVPLDGGKRKVAMSAIESPENWFEDFGSAQLTNGAAVIQFDPDFIQTVNTEKNYRVFPVPNSDCKGLYVTNKTATSFEVHELGGGTSNISFDYRITAIRRKYETVRFADHTNDPDPSKMLEQMRKANPASSSAPALVKPASVAGPGVPVAQLTTK